MAKGFNMHGKPQLKGEDREAAHRAAAAINEYWRARGREVNARVNAAGEIVSDMSAPPPQEKLSQIEDRRLRIARNREARATSQQRFVEYLKSRPTGRTVKELSKALGVALTPAHNRLMEMRQAGIVEAYRTTGNGPMFYRLTPEARG